MVKIHIARRWPGRQFRVSVDEPDYPCYALVRIREPDSAYLGSRLGPFLPLGALALLSGDYDPTPDKLLLDWRRRPTTSAVADPRVSAIGDMFEPHTDSFSAREPLSVTLRSARTADRC